MRSGLLVHDTCSDICDYSRFPVVFTDISCSRGAVGEKKWDKDCPGSVCLSAPCPPGSGKWNAVCVCLKPEFPLVSDNLKELRWISGTRSARKGFATVNRFQADADKRVWRSPNAQSCSQTLRSLCGFVNGSTGNR